MTVRLPRTDARAQRSDDRICYIVINHRPLPGLLRLLRALRSQQPRATLVVHHDPSACPIDAALVERETGAHVMMAPRPVKWGSFELTQAHWRVLDWATANTQCHWFVLLSGQDYPVQPLKALEDKLATTPANAYMPALPYASGDARERRDLHLRYWYRYFWRLDRQALSRVPAPLRPLATKVRDGAANRVFSKEGRLYFYHLADGMGKVLGWRRRAVPYGEDFPLWKGSNWVTMDRKAAEALQRFRTDHPQYVEHCRHTLLSDESATQTVLMNDPSLHVELDLLHCMRWDDPPGPHPYLLTSADFDFLVASGKPFARKFDAGVDADILDRLDDWLQSSPGAEINMREGIAGHSVLDEVGSSPIAGAGSHSSA